MNFFARVYREVKKIPKGRVASYGQIADRLGHPRAARAVGLALSRLPENFPLPWHRVLNSQGMVSIENLAVPKAEQARRLQEEGTEVKLKDRNYWVDLSKYLWKNPKS